MSRNSPELSLQQTLAIERTRSDLQRLLREHEIKYERLHAERAKRVAELYQHIVETNDAAEACLEAFEEKPDKMRFDLADKAINYGNQLAEYVIRNQIYFSRSLARELRELYTCLLDVAITYKMRCEEMKQNKDCSDFVDWKPIHWLLIVAGTVLKS
jgi:transcription termination factor NusB